MKLLLFIIFPLITIAQYPQKIVIDGDTVVAITPAQLDSCNGEHIRLQGCKEMNSYLLKIIRNDEETFLKSDSANYSLMQSKMLCDSVNDKLYAIIDLNKKLKQEDNRKLWWAKLWRDVFFVTTVAFGGKLFIK